jgi:hypothetical protein
MKLTKNDTERLLEEIKRQNEETLANQNKSEKDQFTELQDMYYRTPRSNLS